MAASLSALASTDTAAYVASTRVGVLAQSSINLVAARVPLGATAVAGSKAMLNWVISSA